MFFVATPPLCLNAGLLQMEGVGRLHGWQWLFLVEGLLTVLMGVYLAMALASNPSKVITAAIKLAMCPSMSHSPAAVWCWCAPC